MTLDELKKLCEPPQDYRIFNHRQEDGSFRPISEFFEEASKLVDNKNGTEFCTKISPKEKRGM